MLAILAKPKHSYALYELLADCYCRGQNDVQISLSNLKNYLGIPKDSYLLFKEFKKFVLKPNIEAINKHTDYFVTYQTFRDRRQIGGLIFRIKKQEWQPPLFIGAIQELQRYFDTAALASLAGASTETMTEEQDFIASVAAYRISDDDARKAIMTHGLDGAMEIRDYALGEVERRKKTSNPVRNTGAYMAECFRKGHGKKTERERKEGEEKRREESARKRNKELQQELDRIEKAAYRARDERFLKEKATLSSEREQSLKEEFAASISNGIYGEMVKCAFESKGWKAAGITPMFSSFLKQRLLAPEIDDFRVEAVRLGQDYDALVAAAGRKTN
jgi:hypothetical protein